MRYTASTRLLSMAGRDSCCLHCQHSAAGNGWQRQLLPALPALGCWQWQAETAVACTASTRLLSMAGRDSCCLHCQHSLGDCQWLAVTAVAWTASASAAVNGCQRQLLPALPALGYSQWLAETAVACTASTRLLIMAANVSCCLHCQHSAAINGCQRQLLPRPPSVVKVTMATRLSS